MSIFKNIDILKLNVDYLLNNIFDDLSEIMSQYNSDKGFGLSKKFIDNDEYPSNRVCHNYTYFYNTLFHSFRNENLLIFELGVGVPACMGEGSWAGSLKGWADYFPNSKVYSADIDKEWLYNTDRIKSYYLDVENTDSIEELWKIVPEEQFDLIIDDGPHTHLSNILFYKNSIHKLKKNGLYIIEDVSLDFIDILYTEIKDYNEIHDIKYDIIKLIIPWPKKFEHASEYILKMNNLLFIHVH